MDFRKLMSFNSGIKLRSFLEKNLKRVSPPSFILDYKIIQFVYLLFEEITQFNTVLDAANFIRVQLMVVVGVFSLHF